MLSKYDTDKGAAASFGEFKMPPDSGPPLPPGRPKPYDAPARESGASRDRFDASADSIEKRTAALKAETSAIDLGTQAREAARVTAELETVAKQANTLAGINNGEVTAEQAERIRQVAAAYGAAALAAEQARGPLASFAREARNSNRMLQEAAVSGFRGFEDALISIIDRTSTVQEAFKKMAQSILNDLARIAIRQAITGPIAGALGLAFPGRAAGGPVEAGQPYMVGERGPELFVPRASGRIVPNNIASRGGGASVVVQITNAPSFSTDMSPAARAQIMSDMERNNSMLRAEIVQDIRAGLSNDSSYLTR
jgi:phage-related minor tail protein